MSDQAHCFNEFTEEIHLKVSVGVIPALTEYFITLRCSVLSSDVIILGQQIFKQVLFNHALLVQKCTNDLKTLHALRAYVRIMFRKFIWRLYLNYTCYTQLNHR